MEVVSRKWEVKFAEVVSSRKQKVQQTIREGTY